ncbi:MAG: DcrB-related protein, partial [bacterium]
DVRPMDAIFFCLADPGVNISVTWTAAGGEKELTEAAVNEMKEMLRKSYPGYSVTAEEWRELDGVRAYALSARHRGMGAELQNKQVMFIKGDRFYTITYTSTPALFLKHLGEFELAVGSFGTVGEKAPPVVP